MAGLPIYTETIVKNGNPYHIDVVTDAMLNANAAIRITLATPRVVELDGIHWEETGKYFTGDHDLGTTLRNIDHRFNVVILAD